MRTSAQVFAETVLLCNNLARELGMLPFALALVYDFQVHVTYINPKGVLHVLSVDLETKAREKASEWFNNNWSGGFACIEGLSEPLQTFLTALATVSIDHSIEFSRLRVVERADVIILKSHKPDHALTMLERCLTQFSTYRWGTFVTECGTYCVFLDFGKDSTIVAEIVRR